MINIDTFKNMALAFPDSYEMPHFQKLSYRTKSRIFATLDIANQRACLRLTEIDQSIFSTIDPAIIYPVNNKWGKQGWTYMELNKIKKRILSDALIKAYKIAAPITKA